VIRDLPPKPVRLTIRSTLASLAVVAVFTTMTPAAFADSLDDERRRVGDEISQLGEQRSSLQGRIAGQSAAVAEADANNAAAIQALQEAEARLAEAEAQLAKAESDLKAAEELDAQRAAELEAAEIALAKAQADVAAAQAAYDSLNRRIDEEITIVTQQQGPLVNLALLLTETSAADLNHRAQLGTTLFDASALELDEAERLRFVLDEAQARADAAEQAAAEARRIAAEQLAASKEARQRAADLQAQVAQLVAERDAAAAAAEDALARERQIQADMEAENDAVEQRIQQRMAEAGKLDQQINERNRRQEEERRKREAEAQRQRDAAAKAKRDQQASSAKQKRSTSSSRSNSRPAPKPAASSSGSGFTMPSGARITSRFGMRLHPVTGIYKLHDGTDFGASCGSPIRAAADGVVTERYYNRGYGNRLMIDHGRINGYSVTTGYNHATRYTVGVGQRVKRGQTIGYVGSTGYSTGCHLHLMVWENGRVVNPMARWF
jgi:murein DD-endopeptidase MepM/ murein hydrolase activator NlpD